MCTDAREIAKAFVGDPACAINFQSAYDYDCYEESATNTYTCTGTIETVEERSIECDYDNNGDGFTFNVVD